MYALKTLISKEKKICTSNVNAKNVNSNSENIEDQRKGLLLHFGTKMQPAID